MLENEEVQFGELLKASDSFLDKMKYELDGMLCRTEEATSFAKVRNFEEEKEK